jgi:2-polyprenyl-3-methyl-5-hydroxy-6-metoxy-1,4-benzoquinol methylase
MCTTTVDRSDALVERLFQDTIGTLELFSIYIGSELGLYERLADEPATPAQLAARAGIAERYAREWLEQQAVAGLLEADDSEGERRFALPTDHARVLASPDDSAHLAPFAHMLAGIGGVLDDVVDAYRSGGGVPYSSYGRAFRHGQGHINRPAFVHELPTDWMDALPDVRGRLAEQGGRVADVGCGQGFSTVAMARAFPRAQVEGIDVDEGSVEDARRHAAEAGVGATFVAADALDIAERGPYDLVLVLEALHDMTRPVEVLTAIRSALAPDGVALIVDERVADRFAAPGDEVERMMYGWSVTHCLPTQMVEQPSAAVGTVLRADTLREFATEAGFGRVCVLPVENDLFRLYRLED